jgi:uncharacterized protein
MIRGLLRLIFYAIVFYIAYAIIRFFQKQGNKSSGSTAQDSKRTQGLMVKDEICNTYVPREDALLEVREGKEHFFCSAECRRKFLEQRKAG